MPRLLAVAAVIPFLLGAGALAQDPPPAVDEAPPPQLVPVVPARPMSLCEFADCFQPTPGCHQVLLINPVTGCTECVKFTLPCGCPKVCARKREVVFDYGRYAVRIKFRVITGRVVVIS